MSQSSLKTRNRISLATHAGEGRSAAGWIGAVALHVAIVAATMFTWQHRLDIADESAPVIPVDLVTVAAKTNIAPSVRRQPKIQPDIAPEPVQPNQLAVQQPSVPQEDTEPTPADAAPSEPLIKTPPPPAIPKLKPQPAKPDTKKTFNVDNVLALLNHVAPAASSAPNTRIADRNVKGFGAQNAMTADLEDALRSQIKPCWSPPVGAPHPEQLVVNFDLFLNPDGSVAQPPQLAADSASAAASNPYVQAAAEAARRAIYTCAPYKLPADKYADWREINPFTFDPRQMVGQ
jgi:outer membrane biosynthesis protein TonB